MAGLVVVVAGVALLGIAVWQWMERGFGALDPRQTMRIVIPAVTVMILGIQTVFAFFLIGVLSIRRKGTNPMNGYHI